MIPGKISRRIVYDRLAWIERMLSEIRTLPLDSREAFLADRRNVWAAESCLRRTLEALLDIGRHILAKGFGIGVTEYKETARELARVGVLSQLEAGTLRMLAGYRNRLVHFYHEISEDELYEIVSTQLSDIEQVTMLLRDWLERNASLVVEDL